MSEITSSYKGDLRNEGINFRRSRRTENFYPLVATNPSGSQFFYDTTGSTDKTLKLYEGHYHDLLNDVDKEIVMADINDWIDARVPAIQTKSVALS